MSNTPIVPCLWLDDQAEQAAAFYSETFPGGRVTATSRYPETSDNPSGKPRGSVLTVEIEVAGQRFTLVNGGPQFVMNPSISFFVQVESADEVDGLCAALLDGGKALMPVDTYPWSPRYGWVQDRYGASWQVMAREKSSDDATIVPCLMFVGDKAGRAEEAMKLYTSVFPGGRINSVDRYAEGEGGEPAGRVKHGRFLLDGQELVAMDSSPHAFDFNEAVSLQVLCDDQATLDRYWSALSEGGEEGPCGWLKDPYGVSWQIAPSRTVEWMTSEDTAARDRAFAAMLKMKKLDIAALEAAFAGR